MASLQATLDQPIEDARVATRRVAGEQGWALAEGESHDDSLVFKKGVKAFSWGSKITVQLQASSERETRLTLTTGETFALTDWGRGRRAATRLLEGLGAREG